MKEIILTYLSIIIGIGVLAPVGTIVAACIGFICFKVAQPLLEWMRKHI